MAIIKRKSASEQIIDYILNEIEEGNLKPGAKLMSERDFSEMLGVSRVPLREAICALATLGIVDPRQGDGTFINHFNSGILGRIMYIYTILDEISAHELLEVRAFLESAAAMLAARRKNAEDIGQIINAQYCFEKAVDRYRDKGGNEQDVFSADAGFHSTLAKCTQNRLLKEFLEAVRKPVQKHFNQEKNKEVLLKAFSDSVSFHRDIVDAVERGSRMEAYEVMMEHVLHVAEASADNALL